MDASLVRLRVGFGDFDARGNSIEGKTNYGGMQPGSLCNMVLDRTTMLSLGNGPMCSWIAPSVLVVSLGAASALAPTSLYQEDVQDPEVNATRTYRGWDGRIRLVNNTIMSFYENSFSTFGELDVALDASAMQPRIVLSAPVIVGLCDAAVVSMTNSYGGGSRKLGVKWWITEHGNRTISFKRRCETFGNPSSGTCAFNATGEGSCYDVCESRTRNACGSDCTTSPQDGSCTAALMGSEEACGGASCPGCTTVKAFGSEVVTSLRDHTLDTYLNASSDQNAYTIEFGNLDLRPGDTYTFQSTITNMLRKSATGSITLNKVAVNLPKVIASESYMQVFSNEDVIITTVTDTPKSKPGCVIPPSWTQVEYQWRISAEKPPNPFCNGTYWTVEGTLGLISSVCGYLNTTGGLNMTGQCNSSCARSLLFELNNCWDVPTAPPAPPGYLKQSRIMMAPCLNGGDVNFQMTKTHVANAVSQAPTILLDLTTYRTKNLYVPKLSLPAFYTWHFNIDAWLSMQPENVNNETRIEVKVEAESIQARIAGGNRRVTVNSDVLLDGRGAKDRITGEYLIDPSFVDGETYFEWSCYMPQYPRTRTGEQIFDRSAYVSSTCTGPSPPPIDRPAGSGLPIPAQCTGNATTVNATCSGFSNDYEERWVEPTCVGPGTHNVTYYYYANSTQNSTHKSYELVNTCSYKFLRSERSQLNCTDIDNECKYTQGWINISGYSCAARFKASDVKDQVACTNYFNGVGVPNGCSYAGAYAPSCSSEFNVIASRMALAGAVAKAQRNAKCAVGQPPGAHYLSVADVPPSVGTYYLDATCQGQSPDFDSVLLKASCVGLALDNTSCAAIWNASAVQDEFNCTHGFLSSGFANLSSGINSSNSSNGSLVSNSSNISRWEQNNATNGCSYVPARVHVTGYNCAADFAANRLSSTTAADCTRNGSRICKYTAPSGPHCGAGCRLQTREALTSFCATTYTAPGPGREYCPTGCDFASQYYPDCSAEFAAINGTVRGDCLPGCVYTIAVERSHGPCLTNDLQQLSFPREPVVKIPKNTLLTARGNSDGVVHDITLTITKISYANGRIGRRSATATAQLKAVAGDRPTVYVYPQAMDKTNPSSKLTIVAKVRATRAEIVAMKWFVIEGQLLLDQPETTSTGRNSNNLVVSPGSLVPGQKLRLRLLVTDAYGNKGYGETVIVVNQPPSSGAFAALPLLGHAVQTDFVLFTDSLQMTAWADDYDDMPLKYGFTFSSFDNKTQEVRETTLGQLQPSLNKTTQLPMGTLGNRLCDKCCTHI